MSHTSLGPRVPRAFTPRTGPFSTTQESLFADSRPRTGTSRPATARSRCPAKSPRYRTIQSRCGNFALIDEPPKPQRKSFITFRTPEVTSRAPIIDISSTNDLANTDEITLETLSNLAAANYLQVLTKVPLFLRALRRSGRLNANIIETYSAKLPGAALARFVANMAHESGVFSKVTGSASLAEVETALSELIPMRSAAFWVITETADSVLSPTLGEILPIRSSIVGYSILHETDVVTGDPGDHPGFSVDNDMQLLRDCRALVILPIKDTKGETVAAMQIIGSEQNVISVYYQEVFRIVRDIVQEKFFWVSRGNEISSAVTNVFHEIEETSCGVIAERIAKFLQDSVPCELAEVFQFNDRKRTMLRLVDGNEFDENSGGIAFVAGLTKDPVVCYHHHRHPKFNPDIDGKLTNKSVLALSLFAPRVHFVIALRAKWKSPVFVPEDVVFLREVGPVICDILRVSASLRAVNEKNADVERRKVVTDVICEAIHEFWGGSVEPFEVLNAAAKKLFGCEHCFVCEFLGTDMKYYPNMITKNYDECISGRAYNYRKVFCYDEGEFDGSLYVSLGVEVKNAVAFPYRSNGKVVGAIELVNYNRDSVDDLARENIGTLASFLFPEIGTCV